MFNATTVQRRSFTRAMEKARGLYSLKRGRALPVSFIDSTFTLYYYFYYYYERHTIFKN